MAVKVRKPRVRNTTTDGIKAVFASGLIRLALLLPYRTRIRLFGWLVATVGGPLLGWKRRVRDNLALVMPELPKDEVERIATRVCNNAGRTLIEIYSGEEFLRHVTGTPIAGPGAAALEQGMAEGRRMVLVTAHLGNYDVIRGELSRRGLQIAAIYKPMAIQAFNQHYVDAISAISEPVYPVDRAGVSNLVRHLKSGGSIGIVADVNSFQGAVLSFFDQPAHTALSAAEWTLKYDALMIPVFGVRQKDGLSFRIHVEEPVAAGTPEEMMQRYNDVVEKVVRDNCDQWFWIHRRWKHKRGKKVAV